MKEYEKIDWKADLIQNIISNLKDKVYNINDLLNKFFENGFGDKLEERVLELLYLYNVYKNGYISIDPRFSSKLEYNGIVKTLQAKNKEELKEGIKELEKLVSIVKKAEENPIETAKRKEQDKIKYSGEIF